MYSFFPTSKTGETQKERGDWNGKGKGSVSEGAFVTREGAVSPGMRASVRFPVSPGKE